jgi:DNA polymerase
VSSGPEASVDPSDDFGAELQSIVGSARELLAELSEEGVDEFAKLAAAPAPPEQSVESARRPEPAPPASQTDPQAQAPPAQPSSEPLPVTASAREASWPEHPTLDQVREQLGECTRCQLCAGRKTIVFGSGNPEASLMFIGEGPGQQEDEQGLPFVGPAGELLTGMIEKGLGIARGEVYICNIVKCRPPNNRNPLPAEVAACQPFLDGQIAAVKPKVIVSLGKPAASLLLGREVAITRMRGSWQSYRGIPLMPTLHPAYILREYTPENRRMVWEDLKAALAKAREDG